MGNTNNYDINYKNQIKGWCILNYSCFSQKNIWISDHLYKILYCIEKLTYFIEVWTDAKVIYDSTQKLCVQLCENVTKVTGHL